jgi:hypothetical protein
MKDVATQQWASDYPDFAWLYFVTATTHRTTYCPRVVDGGNAIEIQDDAVGSSGYGLCLAPVLVSTSPISWYIGTDSKASCDSGTRESDWWFPSYDGVNSSDGVGYWTFQNPITVPPECIYDDGQEPAILTTDGCNGANKPQEFEWAALGNATPQRAT